MKFWLNKKVNNQMENNNKMRISEEHGKIKEKKKKGKKSQQPKKNRRKFKECWLIYYYSFIAIQDLNKLKEEEKRQSYFKK